MLIWFKRVQDSQLNPVLYISHYEKDYPDCFISGFSFFSVAQPAKNITVKIDQHQNDIKQTMWGIFFEDINLAADGGIYAELVKNRSFEFTTPLMGWKEQRKGVVGGSLWVLNRGVANQNNPRYIRVQNALSGNYGITNEGFRGIG